MRFASAVDSSIRAEDTVELATFARPVFEEAADDAGLLAVEEAFAFAEFWRNDFEALAAVTARVVAAARRVGDRRAESDGLGFLNVAWFFGPTPLDEFLAAIESQPEDLATHHRLVFRAQALAMRGDFESARSIVAAYRARLEEIGGKTMLAVSAMGSGEIEMLAGDNETAERILAEGCQQLEAMERSAGCRRWSGTAGRPSTGSGGSTRRRPVPRKGSRSAHRTTSSHKSSRGA